MKLVTYNVKGLNTPGKRRLLLNDLTKNQIDIACIQETHFRDDHTPAIYTKVYPIQFHSQAATKSKGVTVLIHKDVAITIHQKSIDPKGRYIILVGQFNSIQLTLIATYFPNERQGQYLRMLLNKIDGIKQGNIILCGDFNSIQSPTLDTTATLTVQRDANAFIWEGKKPRVARKLLAAPQRAGGLTVPDIRAYYHASILAAALPHLIDQPPPQWVTLERHLTEPYELSHVIWLPKPLRPPMVDPPEQINLLLQVWDTHRNKLSSNSQVSQATPIQALTYCIPTFHATPWHDRGVTTLAQAHTGKRLTDFNTLQQTYNIPNTSHFSYRQLASFLHNHNPDSTQQDPGPHIHTLWEDICIKRRLPKIHRPLSSCYKQILQYTPLAEASPAIQWGRELGTDLTNQQWEDLVTSPRKLIKSATLIEQHMKMVYRWYLVPEKLHKLYPSSSPECWRCTKHIGTTVHVWWHCPLIQPFWKAVQKVLKELSLDEPQYEPSTYLLLVLAPKTPPYIKKLVYHLLLTAQRAIARAWKTHATPPIELVLAEIDNQKIYEKRFNTVCPPNEMTRATWERWEAWRREHPT
ncbi:Hypothetical predicted protein [Pelobates cultripes]|uniref:exodeoxyribonuclease III n=1 Tax=Pelobates cultripes TaxID=61616 RepID=A0AAD1RA12_PELCU|nr:Hypothetical predicted protein [Pelobates cultripes]